MSDKVHLGQLENLILANLDNDDILLAAATYEGTTYYVGGFSHICGYAFSDVASASNGLVVEQAARSADFGSGAVSSTLVTVSYFSITAGDIESNAFSVQIVAPYARIFYTNGATNQASFRLIAMARTIRGL